MMKLSRLGLPGAMFGIFVATACGSEGGSSSGATLDGGIQAPPATGPAADACRRYVQALFHCAPATTTDAYVQRIGDRAREICQVRMVLPGTSWNAQQAEACATALETRACEDEVTPEACAPRPGTIAQGSPCNDNAQCSTTACVVSLVADGGAVTTAPCGTCKPRLAEGDACGTPSTDGVCGSDFTCDGTCKRVTYGGEGASCASFATRCMDGLYCTSADICAARLPEGSVCTADRECASGHACDPATDKCVKRKTAQPGEPCDSVTSCSGGSCSNDEGGVCPIILADGDPCDSADRTKTCDLFASCRDGVCRRVYSDVCQ